MIRRRKTGNPYVVYTDAMTFLFGWAIMIICMLLVSAHLVVQNNTSKVNANGQYMITLTWDDKRDVDLDLWLRDPYNEIISYVNREAKNISLDRDSRGFISNKQVLKDGRAVYSGNHEVITIRAIIPGDYLVAVGYYSSNEGSSPIDAVVKVIKINPEYGEVFGQEIHLTAVKEAQNIVAFHIDNNGNISIIPTPQENLIYSVGGAAVQRQGPGGPP